MKPQIIALIAAAAASVGTFLEHRVARRRAAGGDLAPGEVGLRYPVFTRLLAACIAVGAPPLAASLAWEAGADLGVCLAVAGFFALAGFLLSIETFGSRVVVSHAGLVRTSPWSGVVAIDWDDVASVRWSPAVRSIEVRSESGASVHASAYLGGVATLARSVLDEVPVAAFADDATRRALDAIAGASA